ncbi:hypothetical protein LTR09_008345 [Extremus antarcticus]|uniref:Uncharacterized protein n=1 Tax=Extremus antarcticus TaxID=702011 RepID=A0AAJ0GCG4_9PEZI|nr:hypothetical protein LTR09_008345 [Extremus antarcticus]
MSPPTTRNAGMFVWLNRTNIGEASIFWRWSINQGVDGHPLCVVSTRDSGKISCCVVSTSFRDTIIQEKFRDSNRHEKQKRFDTHLAIDHDDGTQPHSQAELLHLKPGRQMAKQSYINMDSFFEVETKYLDTWRSNSCRLDSQSLSYLQSQFSKHLLAVRPDSDTYENRSPLDHWTFDPLSLGVPASAISRPWRRGTPPLLPAPGDFPGVPRPTARIAHDPRTLRKWRSHDSFFTSTVNTPTQYTKPLGSWRSADKVNMSASNAWTAPSWRPASNNTIPNFVKPAPGSHALKITRPLP